MPHTQPPNITFGPVPSRRLGRSLGINNIPPKSCSYSCIYCQVGPTARPEIEPRHFYSPEQILQAVTQHLQAAHQAGQRIDYLTFVPDGEPTLDSNLAKTIELLRPLGIKIAVISNASLIWRKAVRDMLHKSDWVSLKIDTADNELWHRINQPHPDLQLADILEGIREFAQDYAGILTSETMLLADYNDNTVALEAIAEFLFTVQPDIAYLAVPIRPPAQQAVQIPAEQRIIQAYDIFAAKLRKVQYLIGYEATSFNPTGDPEDDLLAITAVHPMRKEAVQHFLNEAKLDWDFIKKLLQQGELIEVEYLGQLFYMRRPNLFN